MKIKIFTAQNENSLEWLVNQFIENNSQTKGVHLEVSDIKVTPHLLSYGENKFQREYVGVISYKLIPIPNPLENGEASGLKDAIKIA